MSATATLTGPQAPIDPRVCTLAYGPNDDGRCWWDGRPIPPGRARWCSARCETAYDEAHIWHLARDAAIRRAAGRCWCGTRTRIEVHHDPPVPRDGGYDPGCQHHPERLQVLCKRHHADAHRNLRAKPGTQLALFRAA
jgi:hypothetical protein